MSTGWDLYCRTCKSEAGLDWNHGNFALSAVWHVRYAIVALHTAGQDIDVMRFGDVLPRSEYGDFDGACNADIKCATCGHSVSKCTKPRGHEPPCYDAPLPASVKPPAGDGER